MTTILKANTAATKCIFAFRSFLKNSKTPFMAKENDDNMILILNRWAGITGPPG